VAEPSAPVPAPVAAEPAPAASSEGGDSDDEERAGGIVGPAPE
jgi:hypothetical protein